MGLKAKPERIASEFVSLTAQTVEAFLKRHRWRLLLPASDTIPKMPPHARWLNPDTIRWDVDAKGNEAPGQFQGDERKTDPETGEPIPGTQRPARPMKQRKPLTELRQCERCKKLTPHIVIETKKVDGRLHHEYGCLPCRDTGMQDSRNKREKKVAEINYPQEETALLRWSALLAGMWTSEGAQEACEAIEQIFSSERLRLPSWKESLQRRNTKAALGSTLAPNPRGTGELYRDANNPNSILGVPSERPAIRITSNGFQFEHRDLLDTIAWTILEASKRGFLRRCKRRCDIPLFVAMHSRQDYCFKCGGIEAARRRKRNWATKNRAQKKRASKRRQRAA